MMITPTTCIYSPVLTHCACSGTRFPGLQTHLDKKETLAALGRASPCLLLLSGATPTTLSGASSPCLLLLKDLSATTTESGAVMSKEGKVKLKACAPKMYRGDGGGGWDWEAPSSDAADTADA